jgi:hypothetical protein
MTVWVVYVPWDYRSSEIVGLFREEKDAEEAARCRRMDEDTEEVLIEPHTLE